MIATKVKISQETRAKLLNPVLSLERKRKLREEFVKDSIRKANTRTKQELIAAAGFNPMRTTSEYANGINLINSMIKRGIISHNQTKSFKKTWHINEEVKVTPSPKAIAQKIVKPVVTVEKKELDKVTLLDMAKDFAWRENSDSLRDFVAYMQNIVK